MRRLKPTWRWIVLPATVAAFSSGTGAKRRYVALADAAKSKIGFNAQIRPILSNCFSCHEPDDKKRAAKLRLDVRDSAIVDRGGYATIVPGNPDKSELIKRVTAHGDDLMPPPESKK